MIVSRSYLLTLQILAIGACCGTTPCPTPPGDMGITERLLEVRPPDRQHAYLVAATAHKRIEIEAALKGPLFGVAYKQDQLRIVPGCTLDDHKYKFSRFASKDDAIDISTADELQANVPFYVGSIEGKLKKSYKLTILSRLAGEYSAPPLASLNGVTFPAACSTYGATHLVIGADVGAFRLVVRKAQQAGFELNTIWSAKVGAQTSAGAEIVTREGERETCDSDPAPACAAAISLRLLPLRIVAGGQDVRQLLNNTIDVVRILSKIDPKDTQYVTNAREFWELYNKKLIGVETKALEIAMVRLGNEFTKCGFGNDKVQAAVPPQSFSQECGPGITLRTLAIDVERAATEQLAAFGQE